MPECLSCQMLGMLFEVPGHKTKPAYLCGECYDDYVKGYIMIAYCDNCLVEFATGDTDPPYMCKGCVGSVARQATAEEEAEIERQYELAYTQYEKSGEGNNRHSYEEYEEKDYLPETKPHENICVRRALNEYANARKNMDKDEIRLRAMTWFKILNGLPDSEPCMARIAKQAREHNIQPMTLIRTFARHDVVEEGLDELIGLVKERGYLAYQAVVNDDLTRSLGFDENCTECFDEYMRHQKMTLCLEKDDPLSDMPF